MDKLEKKMKGRAELVLSIVQSDRDYELWKRRGTTQVVISACLIVFMCRLEGQNYNSAA